MKPAGGSASPGVIVAVAGIALSFIVMLASIAIVTGFKREITRRVIGFEQQITISPGASYGPERVNGGLRLTDSLSSVITSVQKVDGRRRCRVPARTVHCVHRPLQPGVDQGKERCESHPDLL